MYIKQKVLKKNKFLNLKYIFLHLSLKTIFVNMVIKKNKQLKINYGKFHCLTQLFDYFPYKVLYLWKRNNTFIQRRCIKWIKSDIKDFYIDTEDFYFK